MDSGYPNGIPLVERTRERKRNPNKKEQRKIKRNSDNAYFTGRCKHVAETIFSNPPCGCEMRCSVNVTMELRKNLFDHFYSMGCFQIQNAYFCGL